MSAHRLRSLALVPKLIFADARGWRSASFSFFVLMLLGSAALVVALHGSDVDGAGMRNDVVLLVLGLPLPLVLGTLTGARLAKVRQRPALASLPGFAVKAKVSTAFLGGGLVALAAVAGAIGDSSIAAMGPVSLSALSLAAFVAGCWASSAFVDQGRGPVIRCDSRLRESHRSNAGLQPAGAASLSGAQRLRRASSYVLSAERGWSPIRAFVILTIGALGSMVAASFVNVVFADGGSALDRLEGLIFAPYAGGEAAGRIRSASRDLFAPLVFLPLLALMQHRGLGQLPFSRRTIAAYAARRFCSLGAIVFGTVWAFGLLAVAALTWASGATFAERMVPFMVAAALVLAVQPALAVLALVGAGWPQVHRSRRTKSFGFGQLAAGGLLLAVGYVAIQLSVYLALEVRSGATEPLYVALGAVVIFGAGVAALPRVFRRYYASVSLAP